MNWVSFLIGLVIFIIVGPCLGCLLAGLDRVISARMQGRVGPPVLQPLYDVKKLLRKEAASVNSAEGTYIASSLICVIIAGGIFFSGGNFLLCVFVLTLGTLFFIVAAYSTRSPYAEIGASREIVQVMSYEPMVLLVAVGLYMATGSFDVSAITNLAVPMIVPCILFFAGFAYVLTIKLRKSPFDFSYSHHAHQELVKGISTEMSGRTLALVEITHWCETVLFLGWIAMFFYLGTPVSAVVAIVVALVVWLLEIIVDNNAARMKWQFMLKSAWLVALFCGVANILVLGL